MEATSGDQVDQLPAVVPVVGAEEDLILLVERANPTKPPPQPAADAGAAQLEGVEERLDRVLEVVIERVLEENAAEVSSGGGAVYHRKAKS